MNKFKIISISDTHNRHNHHHIQIPECDILIHCGDFTSMGYESEVRDFARWINKQNAGHIIIVPGNHELEFEKQLPASKNWILEHCPTANLLINESINIEGINIYGSPITPWFMDWAFNKHRGEDIQKYWDLIPDNTNILITHGPPHGILDETTNADGTPKPGNLGCIQLINRIKNLKDLDLHFFGHIHAPGGRQIHQDGVSFYNSAVCDEIYYPSNSITIVEYEKE